MKQIREKNKYSVIAYVWNLKIKQTNEYNSTETNSQITEQTCGYQWGEGRGQGSGKGLIGMNYYVENKQATRIYCTTLGNIAIIL